jgi:hypothetical protein
MAQRHQHAPPCPQKAIMTAVTPRRPGRRRAAAAALAASAWAATLAAALAGSHPGHGATAQIAFAAIMATFAMGETLSSPAVPASPGAAGRYRGLGILAFTTGCCMLALAVGALGAGWGTSLLTTLAVACAIASSAVHRLGRQHSGGTPPGRTTQSLAARRCLDATTPAGAEPATTRSESFAGRVGSGV